jgi:polyisoprenyl-phosphate glycosyltransferase
MNKKLISIIIPVYFEELVIKECYKRVKTVLLSLKKYDYELIFVNDGSTDNTLSIGKSIAIQNDKVKIISFSRNFGHQIAITAGMNRAKGDAIIILDADLQDPPEIIPEMIINYEAGYDVVYAIRKNRKEHFIKKIAYKIFYRLMNRLSDIKTPLDSGDFCLMSRKVVDLINSMPEKNRYIRGIRAWVGFKQIGIEYSREKRKIGKTKYTIFKLFKLAFDGIVSFSTKPLQFALNLGLLSIFVGALLIIYIGIQKLFYPEITVSGWASTLSVIVFFSGVQLFTLGVIGEYIGRIFDESKNRPLYIIDEEFNF